MLVSKGAAKQNSSSFSGPTNKGGPLKKKNFCLKTFFVPIRPLSSRREGGKAFVVGPLTEELFFAASLFGIERDNQCAIIV